MLIRSSRSGIWPNNIRNVNQLLYREDCRLLELCNCNFPSLWDSFDVQHKAVCWIESSSTQHLFHSMKYESANNVRRQSIVIRLQVVNPSNLGSIPTKCKKTVKMQWVVHKCLTGSIDLKGVETPLKATPTRDDRQHRETKKWLLKLEQSLAITGDWQYER